MSHSSSCHRRPLATGLLGLLGLGLLAAAPAPRQATPPADADKGTVTGTLKKPDGSPAVKMAVRLTVPGQNRRDPSKPPALSTVDPLGDAISLGGGIDPDGARTVTTGLTDTRGAFRLTAKPGSYELRAGTTASGRVAQKVQVEAGKTATLDLKLAKK